MTALMFAAAGGHEKVCALLADRGVDSNATDGVDSNATDFVSLSNSDLSSMLRSFYFSHLFIYCCD